MKKWILIILLVLTITTVKAGFFPVEGGNSSSTGLWVAIKGFFFSEGCFPTWSENYGSCLSNNTQFKYYTDANGCGVITGIPGDNSTYISCNYCTYNLIYTSLTSCHGRRNETQNITIYDANFSACCNITSLSSDCYGNDTINSTTTYYETVPCGELKMEQVAIAILLVGLVSFLVYMAKNITDKSVDGSIIQLNTYLKMFLYGMAGLSSFIGIIIAVAMADSAGLAAQITNPLATLYSFIMWGFIILFSIFLLGIVVNTVWGVYLFLVNTFKRPKRKRG